MPMELSQDDLQNIMRQVETDLDEVLKSEASSYSSSGSSMSKDEESGKSPEVSASPAEASSPGGEGSGSASAGGPPMDGGDGAAPGGEAPPMDPSAASPAPAASAAPAGAPAPGAEQPGQPGGLAAQLAAMPPDQLRHLYMEVKAALFQQLGAGQDPAAAAGAPPAPAPAASPAPGAPPAMKAEGDPDKLASDGKVAAPKPGLKQDVFAAAKANKAEGDPDKLASDGKVNAPKPGLKQDVFAAAKKNEQDPRDEKIAELTQMVAGLSKAVEMVLGQPLRKAVTGISQVQKPTGEAQGEATTLTKAEVTAKLKDLDFSKLTKKDRDAINGLYDGRHGVDKVVYLFATK